MAYLAFGEMFFEEGLTDPAKFGLAEQSYSQVVKYPPPGNGAFGYAQYKLGLVFVKTGDTARARCAQAGNRLVERPARRPPGPPRSGWPRRARRRGRPSVARPEPLVVLAPWKDKVDTKGWIRRRGRAAPTPSRWRAAGRQGTRGEPVDGDVLTSMKSLGSCNHPDVTAAGQPAGAPTSSC